MQRNYFKIKGAGLGLAAISYDSPAVLKAFADRKGIQFPLLSDADSIIIRRFGILNPEPKAGTSSYGIPYPGIYVLDARGIVTAKYFEDDYKDRDTAAVILMKKFGIEPDETGTSTKVKHLEITTSVTDSHASPGQHVALLLDGKLEPQVHVYAPGVKGYIPIDLGLMPSPGVTLAAPTYPPSRTMRLEAIQESVPVYEDSFRLVRELTIANEREARAALDARGDLVINGTFRYQACDDKKCYLPASVPVHWTIHYEPLDRERAPAELQHKAH